MAGLDNLLREIQNLAQNEAEQVLLSAKTEAENIQEENREKIESLTKEILDKAESEAKNIAERGASGNKIRRRNEILALKQRLCRDVVEKAKQKLVSLPDSEYFGLLKKWAGRIEGVGQIVVCLNAKDMARNKDGFLESFSKSANVTISEKPADIYGGFLAICGGITINCSIDSMFETHADAIHLEIQRNLFG